MDMKKYDPTKPDEMFNDLVNDDIQREIAKAFLEQYKRAHKHCYKTFAPTEAHDLLPHYRRVCIEDIIPDLAARIGSCVAKPRKNKAKNCSHRLMIKNRIILTQSKVEQEGTLPRNAEFRKGYAKSPQMVFGFIDEGEVSEIENEVPFYTIITHMPVLGNEKVPAFIDIVFPDRNYESIVGHSIKLLDKFPDTIPEITQEETIPDSAKVALVQRGKNA